MISQDCTDSSNDKSPGAGNAIKILNEKCVSAKRKSTTKSLPVSPPKSLSLSISKNKNLSPAKDNMDHYTIQTLKDETNGEEGETFAFVLSKEKNKTQDLGTISGEITEELHLSCDEGESDCGKPEEIVEHVCGKCYKTFRRFSGLKKHLDYCRFDCGYHLRKAEMIKNLDKIEKDAVVMENKDICFCCGESYDTFHLGHINCPDCPKSFKSQVSYERHIFITHAEFSDFPCSICNAKLRTENLLKLHEEQHKNRGKPFACKICGKDFTRLYHLNRHTKYSSCSGNEQDAMTCKVCNKVFFRLDNLRSHLKTHLGTQVTKKPEYRCPECKNCFYSLSTLNIHTRSHTGERPFDCDLCEKKFPSLVALKKHRRYHTGEKPYTCTVCNSSFAVKEVLNRHMKRHTGDKPHRCTECDKCFIQATQLRNHLKTHIRNFVCPECNEKFKTEKQLERHSKTQHKPARYTLLGKLYEKQLYDCGICGVSFKKRNYLERHMAKGDHTDKEVTERNRKGKGKRAVKCEKCNMPFENIRNLQFHMLKVHEDEETPKNENINTTGETVAQQNDSMGNIHILHNVPANIKFPEPNGGVVVQEFIIDDIPTSSNSQTIILPNESYTVIPLESDGIIETVTTNTAPIDVTKEIKKEHEKSLAESLAAAIADNEEEFESGMNLQAEDIKLKENVGKLLDMLVDEKTLKKFGWPITSEENVLCKVIENCGHDLSKDSENYRDCDYGTRIREYVKLLFTVVIHNDSIKALLNNYPIDEVIEYVLGNDDDDDDESEDTKTEK